MVNNLGNFFPQHLKQQVIDDTLKPGLVVAIYATDTKPPKPKRALVVGVADDKVAIATIYFNSEVNPNLFPTDALKEDHMFFPQSNREYLSKDCYLDCGNLHFIQKNVLHNLLDNDPDCYLGTMNNEDFKNVEATIKKSKRLAPYIKKKYNLFY